ncbi:unnamed protein product [Pleuronectes platessa]|uniref:Uncharacterized protein n=1 Tax=Pleuronectes platessa TaxID=8262 RepID=A0A9N7VAW4_PLEPL|nr:unnamed protein product [Pleuronectes platessa]
MFLSHPENRSLEPTTSSHARSPLHSACPPLFVSVHVASGASGCTRTPSCSTHLSLSSSCSIFLCSTSAPEPEETSGGAAQRGGEPEEKRSALVLQEEQEMEKCFPALTERKHGGLKNLPRQSHYACN